MTTPESSGTDEAGFDPMSTAQGTEPSRSPAQFVERTSVRRNVAQMATSQAVSWTLATVSAVIVPRVLGPAVLGQLQLASSLWAIAGVFAVLGTSTHLQLSISRNQRDGLGMLPTVFVARTIAFVVAAVVLTGYVAFIGPDPTFVAIVALSGVGTLVSLWSDVYGSGFIGLERAGTPAAVNVLTRLVLLILTLGVLGAGFGAIAVVGASVVSTLLGCLVLLVMFKRTVRNTASGRRSDVLRSLRPVVTASVPFMAVTLAVMVYKQIDVIVISQIAGARDVGWYAAADLVAGSLFFPTTVIMATVFPTLGRLHVHDPADLRALVRRIYSLLLLVAVPIGFGAAVVGPSFATLLFGPDFDGTGEALVIFGPVTILSFVNTLIGFLAVATGRAKFIALLITGSAIATVPLDMLLVPWAVREFDNGAIGGAVAYVVTESFQLVIALGVVAPYLVTRTWAWRNLRVLVAGALMVAATLPFRHQSLVVPLVIGSLVYPAAAFILRVVEDDQRELLADALGRIGVPTAWIRP